MKNFGRDTGIQPHINVTPLIDVLLVLLIIFMVITPLEPGRFKALIPTPPPPDERVPPDPNPTTLVVTIDAQGALRLNGKEQMGTVNDTGKLSSALTQLFQERKDNRLYAAGKENSANEPLDERILKTVFIKAPRAIRYGEVVKVIDGIKGAGANPVGLQIDDLN